MANVEYIAELRKGSSAWNRWRTMNWEIPSPDLSGANLQRASLRGADLTRVNLSSADLSGTNLEGADLRGADLHNAILRGASLCKANLGEADLHEANLRRADLEGADLHKANLRRANLQEARFSATRLNLADLRKADLRRVNFQGASLRWAELSKARFGWTVLGNVDLRDANGLKQVVHEGPSTIGIDTIYRSRGDIPEFFLRGAGVPHNFIVYLNSLVGKGLEFYSCFISYSSLDHDFAARLYKDLQGNGVRCWYAPHQVQAGQKVHEQIEEAIGVYDKLLVILS